MYKLYVKTHNTTGLKYLGKTKQNPYTYKGSGISWLHHIEENGYDVTTEVLGFYETNLELAIAGRNYSDLHNVVESKEWANNIPETGGGPGQKKGYKFSEESKKKMSLAKQNYVPWNKGTPRTEAVKAKLRNVKRPDNIIRNKLLLSGKKQSPEHIEKNRQAQLARAAIRKAA